MAVEQLFFVGLASNIKNKLSCCFFTLTTGEIPDVSDRIIYSNAKHFSGFAQEYSLLYNPTFSFFIQSIKDIQTSE